MPTRDQSQWPDFLGNGSACTRRVSVASRPAPPALCPCLERPINPKGETRNRQAGGQATRLHPVRRAGPAPIWPNEPKGPGPGEPTVKSTPIASPRTEDPPGRVSPFRPAPGRFHNPGRTAAALACRGGIRGHDEARIRQAPAPMGASMRATSNRPPRAMGTSAGSRSIAGGRDHHDEGLKGRHS
jgi:hypothetical protein